LNAFQIGNKIDKHKRCCLKFKEAHLYKEINFSIAALLESSLLIPKISLKRLTLDTCKFNKDALKVLIISLPKLKSLEEINLIESPSQSSSFYFELQDPIKFGEALSQCA